LGYFHLEEATKKWDAGLDSLTVTQFFKADMALKPDGKPNG